MIFVGCDPHSTGYRLWDTNRQRLIITQNVSFNETRFGNRMQHQDMIFHGQNKVEQESVEQEPVEDTSEAYVPQVPDKAYVPQADMPPPIRKSEYGHVPKDLGPEFMVGDEMAQAIEDDENNSSLIAPLEKAKYGCTIDRRRGAHGSTPKLSGTHSDWSSHQ